MTDWLKQAREWLVQNHGLDESFAERAALLLAYFYQYGLSPTVQSGFRSPEHQAALRAQWDAGNRAGLRVRPAASSDHTRTDWRGRPAARAIDIATTNDGMAARIAKALGIGAGLEFSTPDPGHYYAR